MTPKQLRDATCQDCGDPLGMKMPVNTADDFNALRLESYQTTHRLNDCSKPRWPRNPSKCMHTWQPALIVGSDGLVKGERLRCPNCGTKGPRL